MTSLSSRSSLKAAGTLIALAALATSCAGDVRTSSDDTQVQGSAAALSSAAISGIPVPVASGTTKPTWKGTYPRLLAADALAECTLSQLVGVSEAGVSDTDWFFRDLTQDMGAAPCSSAPAAPATGYTAPEQFFWRWLEGRKLAACNFDTLTKTNRGMDITYTSTVGTASSYGLPTLTTYQAASPTPAFSGAELNQARTKAQDQIHYAWLNLCVAQKLNEHLENIQVALTSESDLLQLQTFVRERALKAVYQYTTIIKALDGSAPTPAISNPWQYLALIRYWPSKAASWATTSGNLGRDLVAAVQLLVNSSKDHTDSLVRSGDAQKSFGDYQSNASTFVAGLDSGLNGPRVDALQAAYGQVSSAYPRAVTADMRAPEIGILLGLARKANALKLTGASKTFDLAANGTTMLNAVEQWVRQQDCIAKSDMTTACYQIPGGTPTDQYVVRQRFNIQPVHANTLIKAIVEHLFGQPGRDLYTTTTPWTYRFDSQDVLLGLPADLLERVPGNHTYTGDFSTAGGGTLTLSQYASFQQLPSASIQSQAWAAIPQAANYINLYAMHPNDLGFAMRSTTNAYYRYGVQYNGVPIGSQSALAYARYSLGRSAVNASAVITAAGPKLWTLLTNTLGPRTVVIRRTTTPISGSTTSACGVWAYNATGTGTLTTPTACNLAGDQGNFVDVYVNTYASDPYTRLIIRQITNPAVQPVTGGTVNLGVTDPVDASITAVTGEVTRRYFFMVTPGTYWEFRLQDVNGNLLPLYKGKLDAPISTSGTINVPFLPLAAFQRGAVFGRFAAYGGELNRRIQRAWEFQANNWSKPLFDGLDLPTDWAPVGDASLHGGQAGEEAYQYFLRAATNAASEATSAIDKAFDVLSLEAQDALALQQNQDKGKTLTQLEEQTVCGAAAVGASTAQTTSCAPSFTTVPVTIPACPSGVTGMCDTLRNDLVLLLGTTATGTVGTPLSTDVANQRTNTAANFEKYKGGAIEGLLLAQWTAWKALDATIATAVSATAASQQEVTAAAAEKAASDIDYSVTRVSNFVQLQTALAGNAAAQAQVASAQNQWTSYKTTLDGAWRDALQVACTPAAYATAIESGYSYSGRNRNPTYDPDTGAWEVPSSAASDAGSRTWSPGAYDAAKQGCVSATNHANDLQAQSEAASALLDASIAATDATIHANNLTTSYLLPAQLMAAFTRAKVAPARLAAVTAQAAAAEAVQLQLVQGAFDSLLRTTTDITAAYNQAKVAKAKIDLDKAMETVDVKARFNLRRAFRSYDLWRARALSENARRLAVAARRAIESRFVVDLSTLKAAETFVEAPALWSDEIYSSDLKPPSAVGLTNAPSTSNNGVYSSKLTDYVNNLQLFVDGYAISRPTETVRSDTEVVQLPGPAAVSEATGGDGTSYEFRDIDSGAWAFYCPSTKTWVRNPDSEKFDVTSWTLKTACGGSAPTRARLSFWLDPWGRFNGVAANSPYSARHNARWKSFAVNLVGSGIRDCSEADDPSTCYSEPFIRYDLNHVGPAMVTDFDETWTSMDIPPGVVEGGKALASEEWLDPVSNGFQTAVVSNVARQEFSGRPLGGAYELILELTPDVRPERIERIQVLAQSDYWVRQ